MNKFLTVEDARMLLFKVKSIFPDANIGKNNWHNGKKVIHLIYWIGSDTVGGTKIILRGKKAFLIEWDSNNSDEILFECKTINGMFRYLKKHYAKQPEFLRKIERVVNFPRGSNEE